MDYTVSDSYATHAPTGQRLHKGNQPVPTEVSDRDLNSVIWSLMEIVKAAGLPGVQFDPDVPTSYQVLLNAIQAIQAAANSDRPGRVSIFLQPTAPVGWLPLEGLLLSRATYAGLWAHVEAVGPVSDETWLAGQWGWFSSGDDVSTFRIPDFRAMFLRGLDNGRGLDAGRVLGAFQSAMNIAHTHSLTIAAALDHIHAITVNAGGDHNHGGITGGVGNHVHDLPTDLGGTSDIQSLNNTSDANESEVGAQTGPAGAHQHSISASGTHVHTASSTAAGAHVHTGTADSAGGGESRPINLAVPFYLKY